MKIVADKDIPFLKGVAEQYGDVSYVSGKDFSKEIIRDADTLIVRTVTRFGEEILKGSSVKLICSATIGYDHIDVNYCDTHGITWKNAPGCNSGSVMQYIVSALIVVSRKKGFDLKNKTIGIVGVGNVGKKVAKACEILGMKVLLNDPPRQEEENSDEFTDLETIKREADIITFHTPLTKEGKYKTYHLGNGDFFNSLKKHPIVINSARGGIIETNAIKEALRNNTISGAIIDCWENEPDIDREYMEMVDLATPHIAGYSADGKANATRMSLENIAEFWKASTDPIKSIMPPQPVDPVIDYNKFKKIEDIILNTYDPQTDHKSLRDNPEKFSSLRSSYPLRREYQAYTVINAEGKTKMILKELGFKIN